MGHPCRVFSYYYYYYYYYYFYYWYSALGPVWAETRVQSGDWYGSGTLHPGQVLRVACHCFPPLFRCSHFSPPGASTSRHDVRDPSGGSGKCGRESFTCRKSTTWDRRLYFPSEGVFSPLKIRRLRPGLNPRTWVLKASTLPLDQRLSNCGPRTTSGPRVLPLWSF